MQPFITSVYTLFQDQSSPGFVSLCMDTAGQQWQDNVATSTRTPHQGKPSIAGSTAAGSCCLSCRRLPLCHPLQASTTSPGTLPAGVTSPVLTSCICHHTCHLAAAANCGRPEAFWLISPHTLLVGVTSPAQALCVCHHTFHCRPGRCKGHSASSEGCQGACCNMTATNNSSSSRSLIYLYNYVQCCSASLAGLRVTLLQVGAVKRPGVQPGV